MRHGPRKSVEIAEKAILLRKEGTKWADISKSLRVSLKWLEYWTAKIGYQGDSSMLKGSPENIARARELRASGVCWKLIARDLGVSWRTLQRAILDEDRRDRDGQQ